MATDRRNTRYTKAERDQHIEEARTNRFTYRSLQWLVRSLFSEKTLNHPSFTLANLSSFYTSSPSRTPRLFKSLGITSEPGKTGRPVYHVTKTPEEMVRALSDNLTLTEFNLLRAYTKTLPHTRAEYKAHQEAIAGTDREKAAKRMAALRAKRRAEKLASGDAEKLRKRALKGLDEDSLEKDMEKSLETQPAEAQQSQSTENSTENGSEQPTEQPTEPEHDFWQDVVNRVAEAEQSFDMAAARANGVRPFNKKTLQMLATKAEQENGEIDTEKMLAEAVKVSQQVEVLHDIRQSLLYTAAQSAISVTHYHSEGVNQYPGPERYQPASFQWYGRGAAAEKLYYSRLLLVTMTAKDEKENE